LTEDRLADQTDFRRLYIVVRGRSRIQDLALKLLYILKDHRGIRDAYGDGNNPYDLLAGATFSLWRAIFLAESAADWDAILMNAEAYLEKVIRDNAITYSDDWNNRKWSFVYYLTNARYRLSDFAEINPAFRARLPKDKSLASIGKSPIGPNRLEIWEDHCEALADAIDLLEESGKPKQPG
jgi:hypothetical protein